MRAAIRRGTQDKSSMARLNQQVWMPNWEAMMRTALVQASTHPGLLPTTAAARLLASSVMRIPNKSLQKGLWASIPSMGTEGMSPAELLRAACGRPLERLWEAVVAWIATHASDAAEGRVAIEEVRRDAQRAGGGTASASGDAASGAGGDEAAGAADGGELPFGRALAALGPKAPESGAEERGSGGG